jgi:hypothetical protein
MLWFLTGNSGLKIIIIIIIMIIINILELEEITRAQQSQGDIYFASLSFVIVEKNLKN